MLAFSLFCVFLSFPLVSSLFEEEEEMSFARGKKVSPSGNKHCVLKRTFDFAE